MSLNQTLPTSSTVRIGRWWFQRRGVSPVPAILLCLVLPSEFVVSQAQSLFIFVGLFIAEGVRVWAVGYAGSVTRTRGDGVGTLVHSGPFRHVRNPLYIANIALYTLFAVAFGFALFAAVIALYFIVQYRFIVAFEEDRLRQEYGAAYQYFCARVPRWIPSFQPSIERSAHPFRLGAALRSERATLVAIGIMGILAWLKQNGL
jgi:protein-S-isoprenylcysteine O-methyltransferase Ste14